MIAPILPLCDACASRLLHVPPPEDDYEQERAERPDVEHVAARCAVCGRWEDEQ